MTDRSRIEWTDATWNPVTGCTKVSPGCDNCYAERDHERWNGKGSFANVTVHESRLSMPLRWRKPRRIFVNSMSDLFHEDVDDAVIADVFAVMQRTPQHTYQLLTKRHGRMRSLLTGDLYDLMARRLTRIGPLGEDIRATGVQWPLPNLWLGVSVEDQKRADLRTLALLDTPAAVRWLSCEPLLGPVDLLGYFPVRPDGAGPAEGLPGIDWVVAGGESGPGARPMDPDWARRLRDQCADFGVPFFFKQAGAVLARQWACTDPKGHNPYEWPEPFPREYPTAHEQPESK